MPKILANGLTIHYQKMGSGPYLIMLHGLTGNLAVWHLKAVPLLRKHYTVVTVDLRGHGYTEMPPSGYTTGDLAEDLHGLMDALEIPTAYLVGHSYGADTVLNFALRYPQRVAKMVIIEATVPALIHLRNRADWEGWTYWSEALKEFGYEVPEEKKTDIDYMIRLSLKVPKVYGPATGRARKPEPLLRLLDTTTMVRDYEGIGDLTLEAIARITTPSLVLYGHGTAYMGTYEYLRTHLPNCEADLLPPTEFAGHFGPLEQPDLLVDYIKRFCPGETASELAYAGAAPVDA